MIFLRAHTVVSKRLTVVVVLVKSTVLICSSCFKTTSSSPIKIAVLIASTIEAPHPLLRHSSALPGYCVRPGNTGDIPRICALVGNWRKLVKSKCILGIPIPRVQEGLLDSISARIGGLAFPCFRGDIWSSKCCPRSQKRGQ